MRRIKIEKLRSKGKGTGRQTKGTAADLIRQSFVKYFKISQVICLAFSFFIISTLNGKAYASEVVEPAEIATDSQESNTAENADESGEPDSASGDAANSDVDSSNSTVDSTASAMSGAVAVEGDALMSEWSRRPIGVSSGGNSGAAVTSIPIIAPPGRKGIEPRISLNYSSNSGNGWLGVGWGLDMGAIQRSTKRGVNYNGDDYVVTVNGSSSELVYIRNIADGVREYRAKIEGAFSRYIKRFDNDDDGWMVTTKDGTTYYYGSTSLSRQDNANGTFKWCLDRVADTNGNYMTITYLKDQGEIYLYRIDYTGNAGLSPSNFVQFYFENRADAPIMYTTNAAVKTAYRVYAIAVYGNGQLTRRYVLNYDHDSPITSRSLLTSVSQYGSDGNSLPAITINYYGSSGSFTDGWSIPVQLKGTCVPYLGDFNGDGKTDVMRACDSNAGNYVYLSTGSSFTDGWSMPVQLKVACVPYLGDFNGDGKTDVMRACDYEADNYVYLSTGSSFSGSWPVPVQLKGTCVPYLGDFNGDGKTDVMRACDSDEANYVYLSTGGSFTDGWPIPVQLKGTCVPYLGDFNGDGKTDVMRACDNDASNHVYLSTGGSFTDGWPVPVQLKGSCIPYLSDFNGDGETDVMRACDSDAANYVYLSTGGSFTGGWPVPVQLKGSCIPYLSDFNGDGKADVMRACDSDAANYVYLSTGGSFGDGWLVPVQLKGSCIPYLSDFNGDGKTDLMRTCDEDVANYVYETAPYVSDLISSVTNGIGGTTTLEYLPSSTYNNCYNDVCLPYITQTLSSVTVNDGNGILSFTGYAYEGGYHDYEDKEFRGFGHVKATALNGTATDTWFNQDDIFKGLPYDQIISDSSGSNIYTRSYNTYYYISPYAGIAFPYLYQKDDYIYDGTSTARQAKTEFTYDSYGNTIRKHFYGDISISGDERDEHTEYNYDTINWIMSLPSTTYVKDGSDVSKAYAWFTYDTKGNLLTKTAWLDTGPDPVITYTYDSYGNVETISDAQGNPPTVITYDTATKTFPWKVTNALGHFAEKTYDYRFGKVLAETDANGNTTSYKYDTFGRIEKVIGPDDTEAIPTVYYEYPLLAEYGQIGVQKVKTYALKNHGINNYIWSEAYFDGLGRTIETRTEGPEYHVIVKRTTYNDRGLVESESLPYFSYEYPRYTSYQYDPIGRIVRTDYPDSKYTYATLSYLKGILTYIDPNFHKKVEEKDIYGRVVRIEEYTGNSPETYSLYSTTTYQYDVLGKLEYVRDEYGNETHMTYDTLSRKTAMDDPDMGHWEYDYDANGNLIYQKDAKLQEIFFQYDELNRLRQKDYQTQKPLGTGDIVYSYDEPFSENFKGRLTTLKDLSGTTKFYYDNLGRTTKTTNTIDSVSYATDTSYDALGRIDTVTYPDPAPANRLKIKYEYDGGNLLRVKDQISGLVYASYSLYNAFDQYGLAIFANGVTRQYQYLFVNNRSLPWYMITSRQGTGFMIPVYSYDNVGNITGITDSLDSTRARTYKYDELDRVTEAGSPSYSGNLVYQYDKIGNMKLNCKYGDYYYDNPLHKHAVTRVVNNGVTTNYSYDDNGNMESGSERSFTYDYDNQPTRITYGSTYVDSVYDAFGNRVKKTTPNSTTIYIGKLYECSNGICSKYVFDGSRRIAKIDSMDTYYYHTDHLGSTSIITDSMGINREDVFYYPYGDVKYNFGSVNVRHKFTGQEYDAEDGLYYYGARYYDPRLARFTSADSIVPDPFDPQALNRYTYVLNNPVNNIDPTGHDDDDYYCCDYPDEYPGMDDPGNSNPPDDSPPDDYCEYLDCSGDDSGGGGTPNPAPAPEPTHPPPAPTPVPGSNYFGQGLNINNINLTGNTIQSSLIAERNGLYYDGYGNIIGEVGLEQPLIDPIDIVAGMGSGYIKWSTRPYWRYVSPQSNPNSGWLTRGPGWRPPYGTNFEKAKDALQLPHMPNDVQQIRVPWYKPVRGPRPALKHPEWGGKGGGPEYYRDWTWPE